MSTWLEHVDKWKDCQRCSLAEQRYRICLGRGTTDKDGIVEVLFVGEAPGPSEDTSGLPFVGPAGKLMDDIISRALSPSIPYALTNLVACYPREAKLRGDNEPERGEIFECRPRLIEFINIVQPRLIVRVGSLVKEYLNFNNTVPMVDIIHPASILRRDMPIAQKQGAANKCVVQIKNAYEDVCQTPRKVWEPWEYEYEYGHQSNRRQQLKQLYRDAENDIPY